MSAVRRAGLSVRVPVAGAVAALAVFMLLALGARDGGGFWWDSSVRNLISDLAPISDEEVHVDPYITVVTLAAGAVAAAVVLVLLRRRRYREALFPVAAVIGASLASVLVKALVDRPAIENADGSGASFPSGTATWSMALAASLVLLAPASRRLPAALAAGLFVVGLGAVIAWEEWHYPSDILAGWCLALACVAGLWLVLLRPRRAQRSNAPASGVL
jgi:membrane-associated phospholipid phosphatase